MKLLLASQGFTTDEIAEEVSKVVDKPLEEINIAIINEAYTAIPGEKSKRWLIKELSNIAKYIGGSIDFVNFRAYNVEEIKNRLSMADLIYIVGGKQFVLYDLFEQTGTTQIMKELAKEKVIMGTSAGSIVLGRQIIIDEYWKERYGLGFNEIKGKVLDLVDFNIIPHYLRKDRIAWDKEFHDRTLKDNPFHLYAVTDTQMVVYNNGEIKFIGGDPVIFGKNRENL